MRVTDEQSAYIRKFWTGPAARTAKQIGQDIGLSQVQVASHAKVLRLVRDRGFVSEARRIARYGKGHVPDTARRLAAEDLEGRPLLAGPWPKGAPWFTDHPRAAPPGTPRRLYGDVAHGMRSSVIATAAGEHA